MENPLISVIVPVYNVQGYLDACMESILAQTYENLQILLVDDGSRDASGAMCDAWAEKDPRIQVLHQQNRGLSGARNAGIDRAEGEFLLFVDSDDVISPVLCSTLLDAMTPQADVSVCDAVHIFPDQPWEYSQGGSRRQYTPGEAIRELWYQTAFLPSAWGKLYRSTLFARRRFTEKRLFEDIDLMHEVFWDARGVVYDTSRLYGYMHRENSITTAAFGPRDLDILLIADKILTFVEDKPDLAAAARAYAVTAGLRVWLNAPQTPALEQGREQARQLVQRYGREVMKDPAIRRKNRYALWLYFYCRPVMRVLYKNINRWK